MIIYSFDGDVKEIEIKNVNFEDDIFYWFNLNLEELQEYNNKLFYFNNSTIEECISLSQLAKVDFFDNYIYMVLNSLKYEDGKVIPDEFNVYLSEKYIVTVSKKDVKILSDLRNDIGNYKSSLYFSKDRSTSKILYYIIDRLIQSDYQIINRLENAADVLEMQIMKNQDREFLNEFLNLRHQVHILRRCVTPLRYIGDNILSNENNVISERDMDNFHHINSKIEKLMFSMESLIQYTALVREALETEMANKTNELVKRFTIISMFFSPLTLITGIYGMNFRMPECDWRFGYIYSLLLMVGVSMGLFLYFKSKKWL